jgi:hypothetical protein
MSGPLVVALWCGASRTMQPLSTTLAQTEEEGRRIAERTKPAPAAAKCTGVKLGNPTGAKHVNVKYESRVTR